MAKKHTKDSAPGADVAAGDEKKQLTPDEVRQLFLTHRQGWIRYQAKLKTLEAEAKDLKAAIRSDGFTIKQMKIADQLADLKGEAKVKSEVEDRLQVARWIGHPLGAQLDLFAEPDRVPAEDVAYDEGKMTSMQGHTAKPRYSPETPQYRAFMAGYHDHQRELAGGLKTPRSADQSTMAHPH